MVRDVSRSGEMILMWGLLSGYRRMSAMAEIVCGAAVVVAVTPQFLLARSKIRVTFNIPHFRGEVVIG